VVSSIAVIVAIGGATAIAATQLPKNGVGAKQLKKKAVTTAKIKNNAVTTAKIRKEAVTGAKINAGAVDGGRIADGSVTGADINPGTVPFGRVVHQARGTGAAALSDATLSQIPLGNATYLQEAGRDDFYMGALDVAFAPSCGAPRALSAYVLADAPDPNNPTTDDVVAAGQIEESNAPSVRVNMSPYAANGVRFSPAISTPHTLGVVIQLSCTGAGGNATVTSAGVDVMGVK
jgi:hypothetical protein